MAYNMETLIYLKEKAESHMSSRKYSWAMVYLSDVVKELESITEHKDPDKIDKLIRQVKVTCQQNLSLCYFKQGNYEGCIELCKIVLQNSNNAAEILYRMGCSYLNVSNIFDAEKFLKRAYLLEPHKKQFMKALQRTEYLRRSRKITLSPHTQNESKSITFGSVIKILMLWPIFMTVWIFKKIIPSKSKNT